MEYILLIIGFVLLIKGADFFVEGSISLAKRLRVPSMIIGLTIVAFGTSAPEAAVSIAASVRGSAGIAVGNIIGSNLFNLLVVTGVCVVLKTMTIPKITIKRDFPFYIFTVALLAALCAGIFGQTAGVLSRIDGVILLVIMAGYLAVLLREALKDRREAQAEQTYQLLGPIKTAFYILLGGAAVVVGGEAVVNGAKGVAESFGLSESLIGLTIVALGTSLPELVTSCVAVSKGEDDMAMGNVIGSNIFNTLFVLGMAASIRPISVDLFAVTDVVICLVLSVLVYLFSMHKLQIGRAKGLAMLFLYGAFLGYAFIR